ncbi:hypothetical protein [Peptoniphilus obesi]|uniref:hypothetical protein n=1 Tax=Peptoniphilus obesi TaxID=1472765 RepID=UPI0004BC833E|nr:hypothetical protein [Peptoniphilus obesi]
MKILKHQNILGTLEYSKEDNLYFGKILNTKGYFLYHGETEEEAIKDFKYRIIDYLDYCKENKIKEV